VNHAAFEAEQRNGCAECDQRGYPIESAVEAFGPENVVAKKQRQIQNHSDYGCCDGGQWRSELQISVRGFNQRPAGEDEYEGRQEGKPGHQCRRHGPGKKHCIRRQNQRKLQP